MERRLRLLAFSRGSALTAIAALVFTVAAVLAANAFAFSSGAVLAARLALFLGLACAIAAALIVPLVRLNRRHAARAAEQKYPEFEQRLLTLSERAGSVDSDPFLQLLAADTLQVAEQARPASVAKTAWIAGFASAAAAAALLLIWLGVAGPGFLGYGTALLWAGPPKGETKPFYSIAVEPGNRTIRKLADQVIHATLFGFTAPKVRFFAKYASAPQWEQAEMSTEPTGSAYQFLIAGVPESLDYYVEAGGIRSAHYHLNVVELPSIKNIRVTYHYPAWTGMKDFVEDPGGDLRAVEGTTAEVAIRTDRPLATGALLLDDGGKVALRYGGNNTLIASVPIQKDGMYHIAAIEGGEDVRLSEDYFIEAQKDHPPEITITRPGDDFKASPIEEVTVAVNASDDFGLRGVDLHYSVNGGPEKTVSMLDAKGARTANGSTVIALEDFKVQPGDIVSLYAEARDARQTTNTDMFFIEAQPFERNYTQSQEIGGGMPGQGDQQNQLSERQKEIITATWNQIKGNGAKATDAENAAFLASVESKLRDQATSLAQRMKARQMEEAGDSFKSFVANIEQAAGAMGPAAGKLRIAKWQDALAPEQKALQYLLRAESVFRDIQVAFGQSGAGGGGISGATRDMEGLFDLELDTEKNQYEGARQNQSADARQRQMDDALQKLQELARRQQELAEQQRRGMSTPQQRWEQEMLRREAEKLQQQMQQLAQNAPLSRDGQQGQQGQSGQAGASAQAGSSGQQSQPGSSSQAQTGPGQMNQRLQNAQAQQLRQTIDRLQQALQDMRQAASSQQAGTPEGEAGARRAADRLREAQQMFTGLRSGQSSGEVGDMARQADSLAHRQQEFEGQMRRAFGPQGSGLDRSQAEQMAQQKEDEVADLKRLEQQMQNATRDLMGTQRQAATRLRDALGDAQQQELVREMDRNAGWIRHGQGEYAALSEAQATAGLNQLRDQLHQIDQELAKNSQAGAGQDDQAAAQALGQVEQLRRQMEQLQAQLANRGRQQPGSQQGGQQGMQGRPGQQGQQSQQGGSPAGAPGSSASSQPNSSGRYADGAGSLRSPYAAGGGMEAPVSPEDLARSYRGAFESLGRLEQQLKDDPDTARDIQSLMRDLRNFDPRYYTNDSLLSQRIQAALAGAEQVEMELRRMVDASSGGSIRSPGGERVPQGYQDAVADYFRKLSKAK
ncbi:MAG: hypothetical protein WCB12_14375 [Bryobacteraceae bacterium]